MINEKTNTKFGIILSYVALAVSLTGTLFISNRVLNLIGDYNYGLYSFVTSIASWLTILSSALTASYLRYASLEARDNSNNTGRTNTIYFKMLLYLGIVILVVGLGVLFTLYKSNINLGKYSWEDSKLMYLLFALSIINISLTMPCTVFQLFVNYNKCFIFEKLLLISTSLLNFAGHFAIAYFTRSIVLIAAFSIFVTIINFTCNFILSKKRLRIEFYKVALAENKTLINSIIAFSSILLLNSVVDQINSQVDKTLLGIFSCPEDVTIYTMGMAFSGYLASFAVAISGVFAPKINELCVNDRKKEIDALFIKVSKMQAIVVTLISFGFVACGKDFIIWWIGDKRVYAYYVGAVLMILNIMPLSVKVTIDIQRALNMHRFRSFLYLVVAVGNVLLSVAMLKIMPEEQAVFACLIGTVVSNVVCQWIAMNIYNAKKIKLPMKRHLITLCKQVLFGVIGVTGALLFKYYIVGDMASVLLKFILEGMVYIIIYCGLLFAFDRKFILGFIRN